MLAAQTRAARLDFEVRQPRGKRVSLRKLLRTGSRDALLARIETSPAAGLGSALASPRYAWARPHRELYSSPEVWSAVYQRMTKSPSAVSLWFVSAAASSRASMATAAAVSSGVSGRVAPGASVSANSAAARVALAGVRVSVPAPARSPRSRRCRARPRASASFRSARPLTRRRGPCDRQVGSRTYSTR